MAKCVIPPKPIIVKCRRCGALYVPDMDKDEINDWSGRFIGFEPCPVCGRTRLGFEDTIPLWRYNLIKLFRGGFRKQNGH